MRVIVQRVSTAAVSIEGRITGQIGRGLLVLAGFEDPDQDADLDWMVQKMLAAYGITLADLGGKARAAKGRKAKAAKPANPAKGAKAKAAKPRKPVAAKYRNAATGDAWSGRGRVPKWLAAELAKGRTREEFAVG